MKTAFAKKENHTPTYFIIDATNKTLGRLASQASFLLSGYNTCLRSPGLDQGNIVIIINAEKIIVSGEKLYKKTYFNSRQRPGGLKNVSFIELKKKAPHMPLQKAILGMLPKNKLRKKYFKRLFIYSSTGSNVSNDLIFSKLNIPYYFL